MIAGLWVLTGFRQVPVEVTKRSKAGSTYGVREKFTVLLNSITSFSDKPLIFIFYLGLGIALLATAAASFLVVRRLFFGALLAGWPSLIVSVWLLGGITIFCLGIIGIYLSRVFIETKQRPYTIIRRIYEHGSSDQ